MLYLKTWVVAILDGAWPLHQNRLCMVVLHVKGEKGVSEWVTLEFQGDIECFEQQRSGEKFRIGTLKLSDAKKNVVELIIGYHQLEGQLVPLKKPLAMLEKVPEECGTGSTATCYQVIGLIKQKIIFKARPKALISKP